MTEAAGGLPATRDELVEALLALTKSIDERVRLGAIQTALDRGWGRPRAFWAEAFGGRRSSAREGAHGRLAVLARTRAYPLGQLAQPITNVRVLDLVVRALRPCYLP